MKRIFALVLALALWLSVCACAPQQPAPEPPPNVKTSPTVAELKAVRQQFWDVDRLNIESFDSGMIATEAMPFVVDLDGDNIDEIGVLYDSYSTSAALFYKHEQNKWAPFYTLYNLPYYFTPFEIEVYQNEKGTILHTTQAETQGVDNSVNYFETYADFSTDEPTVYTPWRTELDGKVNYRDTNFGDSKQITKEEFEALQAEILAGAELKEILSFPTASIDSILSMTDAEKRLKAVLIYEGLFTESNLVLRTDSDKTTDINGNKCYIFSVNGSKSWAISIDGEKIFKRNAETDTWAVPAEISMPIDYNAVFAVEMPAEQQKELFGIGLFAVSNRFDELSKDGVPASERILAYELVSGRVLAGNKDEFAVEIVQNYTCTKAHAPSANGNFAPSADGEAYICTDETMQYRIKYNGNYSRYDIIETGTGGVADGLIHIADPAPLQNNGEELPIIALTKVGIKTVEDYYAQLSDKSVPKIERIFDYELISASVYAGDEKEFAINVAANYKGYHLGISANADVTKNESTGIYTATGDGRQIRIKYNEELEKYEVIETGTGGVGHGLEIIKNQIRITNEQANK